MDKSKNTDRSGQWDGVSADDHRELILKLLIEEYYEEVFQKYCSLSDYDAHKFRIWLVIQDVVQGMVKR